jgi:hypothetical protein
MLPVDVLHYWIWSDWSIDRLSYYFADMDFSVLPPDAPDLPEVPSITGVLVDMPSPPHTLLDQLDSINHRVLLGCSNGNMSWADLVVNVAEGGSLLSEASDERVKPKVFEGAGFALLRPQFLLGRQQPYNQNGPWLVMMGGTDSARLTCPVVKALLKAKFRSGRQILAVCSGHHPDFDELLSLECSDFRLLTPNQKVNVLLEEASSVVLAPGNLLFESLALQTPALAVAQNDRQRIDFQTYPWLLTHFDEQEFLTRMEKLLSLELTPWQQYAHDAQSGQYLHLLNDWFREHQ